MLSNIQRVELRMLHKLDSILKENSIPYWLAFGSTLGAVRHNGFIPWDDDVDIYIMGSDYSKLRDVFLSQDTSTLALHDSQTVKGYPYIFPKIVETSTTLIENKYSHHDYKCGVYIDLFLLFPLPDNPVMSYLTRKWQYLNYVIIDAHYRNLKLLSNTRRIVCWVLKHFSSDKAQNRLYTLYSRPVKRERILGEPHQFENARMHKSVWFKGMETEQFEDAVFPIPNCSKEYLETMYGDYMTLPPVEERIGKHHFDYLDIPDES